MHISYSMWRTTLWMKQLRIPTEVNRWEEKDEDFWQKDELLVILLQMIKLEWIQPPDLESIEDSSEVTSTPTQNDINCYFSINSFVVTAESWCPPPSAVGQPSQCDKPSPCKDSSGHLYIFEMISFPSVLLGVRECIQSFLEHSPIFYLDTGQWTLRQKTKWPGLIILTCTVFSYCW